MTSSVDKGDEGRTSGTGPPSVDAGPNPPPSKSDTKCKWCREGWERRDGQHWIVKSIQPARIKIVACTA
jgi:hypothetical protein